MLHFIAIISFDWFWKSLLFFGFILTYSFQCLNSKVFCKNHSIREITSSSTTTLVTSTSLHSILCCFPMSLFLHSSEQKHAQRQSLHCRAPGRWQLKHLLFTSTQIPINDLPQLLYHVILRIRRVKRYEIMQSMRAT